MFLLPNQSNDWIIEIYDWSVISGGFQTTLGYTRLGFQMLTFISYKKFMQEKLKLHL